jgi:hypothetical protein
MKGVMKDLFHVTRFEYVRQRYVSYVSENTLLFTTEVTLVSGGEWSEVGFTPGTATAGEQRITGEPGGVFFRLRFSGSFPAKDMGYPQLVRQITAEPVYCRMTMSNGKVLIAGPVRLEYTLDAEGHDVVIRFERDSVTGFMEEEGEESGSGS